MNSNISFPSSPLNQPTTPHPKSSLPMLYYGLVVVGTAAAVLVIYNIIIIRWCTDRSPQPALDSGGYKSLVQSSFRFKKGAEEECECAVCLSAFEEGEELRKLPRCAHMFHALCIDMWLYSHSDCPLCRTPAAERRSSAPGLLI